MAGVSSRIGSWALAKQTAKGSAAAAPTHKFFMSGEPSLAPVRDVARYAMTDSGRSAGLSYIRALRVEGDVPVYAHPEGLAILFAGVLGSVAESGTGPYIHTITPATDTPYFTMWRMTGGGTIVEKFSDCKINTLGLTSAAGSPLQITLGIIGVSSEWVASDTANTMLAEDRGYLHMEAENAISIDGADRAIHNLTFNINNNMSGYQADGYIFDDVDPGNLEIGFNFATRFTGATSFPDYKDFFYGAGTSLVTSIGTNAVSVQWIRDANYEFEIQLPQVVYNTIPVNSSPGGEPLEVQVACSVEKPDVSTPEITVLVTDEAATAYTAIL